MQTHRHPLILSLLLGIFWVGIYADVSASTTRTDIEKWCTGSSTAAAGRCIGFLLAVEDAAVMGLTQETPICLPQKTNLKQLYSAVHAWLKQNPSATPRSGFALVTQAYTQAFPCPPPNRTGQN